MITNEGMTSWPTYTQPTEFLRPEGVWCAVDYGEKVVRIFREEIEVLRFIVTEHKEGRYYSAHFIKFGEDVQVSVSEQGH